MGHRANFVVVENQVVSFFRAQFGATSIPADVLGGPDRLIEYARALEPTQGLIDPPWCEGGVLIDRDRLEMLFFEDTGNHAFNESPGLRRRYLPFVAERWPGWSVRLAEAGLADIERALGMVPSPLIREPEPVAPQIGVVTHIFDHPISWQEYREGVSATGRFPSKPHEETVLTLRDASGEVHDYTCGHRIEDLLAAGPSVVDVLVAAEPAPLPNELDAREGAFIDVPARRVEVWWGAPMSDRMTEALAERWPGWTVRRQHEGLPRQAAASGRDPESHRLSPEAAADQLAVVFGFEPDDLAELMRKHVAELRARGATHITTRPTALEPPTTTHDRGAMQADVLMRLRAGRGP